MFSDALTPSSEFYRCFNAAGREYIRHKKQAVRTFAQALSALLCEPGAVEQHKYEVRIALTVLEDWLAYKKSDYATIFL